MDWISTQLLESYKEHIEDESYIKDLEARFNKENKNKYDGLMSILNADERIRKSFAKRLDIKYEDLKVFLHVLQRT